MYLSALIGDHLGIMFTNHIRPKGLWNLVLFRTSGWKSMFDEKKIYRASWVWEELDFKNYYEKKNR